MFAMGMEQDINMENTVCDLKTDISFLAEILNNVRSIVEYDRKQKQPLILKINEGFIFNIVRKALLERDARFLISVTGESASGKTTLVQNAVKACIKSENSEIYSVICCDDYYKDASRELREAGSYENLFAQGFSFDNPNAIDLKLMKEHLLKLKSGIEIKSPRYDFVTCESNPEGELKRAAKILINEGLYVLDDSLLDISDVKVFVFTPFDIIKDRWFKRAVLRGKEGKAAEMQFNNVNQTAYQYIRPTMNISDVVINGLTTQEYIEEITSMFIEAISKVCRKK